MKKSTLYMVLGAGALLAYALHHNGGAPLTGSQPARGALPRTPAAKAMTAAKAKQIQARRRAM